ncbi:hypothetical protein GUJ93_ZPchr0009g2215 [Zizania palustris]|uniref:Uncharacterized protein n=1 Tax=Zizania palustris TaxID=103762 RepID=A0A8J5RM33_ZIZPA|nr:hypothetical protein GUJ93_ZPchr0009g2215 [Zizania palustris]
MAAPGQSAGSAPNSLRRRPLAVPFRTAAPALAPASPGQPAPLAVLERPAVPILAPAFPSQPALWPVRLFVRSLQPAFLAVRNRPPFAAARLALPLRNRSERLVVVPEDPADAGIGCPT